MSDINAGGPAFPVADPFGVHRPQNVDEAMRLAEGMTLRQYAAIKLRVPNSGTDWLDEMIVQSLRDEFAAKAMPAVYADYCESARKAGFDDGWMDGIADDAYAMADAMLKMRES